MLFRSLTIKQIEDYVGKEVAEKIQNEEGKVWDGGSVKQGKLTGQKGKKEGFLLTEKEAGKAWEEADKKYAGFMNRMEKN